ncbi:hypothetical protein GCM10020219_046310 [Nonomuraea dietziae]
MGGGPRSRPDTAGHPCAKQKDIVRLSQPSGCSIVERVSLAEAVQDAHERVGDLAQGGLAGATGPLFVVVGAAAGRDADHGRPR